jgi:putative heme-binding domain-containing protein
MRHALNLAAECPVETIQQAIVLGLGRGAGHSPARLSDARQGASTAGQAMLHELLRRARQTALDETSTNQQRQAAIALLGQDRPSQATPILGELLDQRRPASVQRMAIAALAEFDDVDTGKLLIDRWHDVFPTVQHQLLEAIQSRSQWIAQLLVALETSQLAAEEIPLTARLALVEHSDTAVSNRAKEVFGRLLLNPRDDIIKAYGQALHLKANLGRGEIVYRRQCATCHRLEKTGHTVGTNLALSRNRTGQSLLTEILDPNREMEPAYVQYGVFDKSGRLFSGIVISETASSITLKRADDSERTILRRDIEQIISTGKSLMPEGLEKVISHQEMADLIAYLLDHQYDIGTEAGMVEPRGHKK